MLKDMKLSMPILPQTKNSILDKSALQGENIKVIIPITSTYEYKREDKITVYFTHNGYSITSDLTVTKIPKQNFEIDFPKNIIQNQNYNVHYSVEDTTGNTSKSASIFITITDGSTHNASVEFLNSGVYENAVIITQDRNGNNPTFTFKIDSGFPSIGFPDAYFTLAPTGNSAENGLFEWSVNEPACLAVDAEGTVTLIAPTSEGVVIGRRDGWPEFIFSFSLKKWFVNHEGDTGGISNWPLRPPETLEVASRGWVIRGIIGTLIGEWGSMLSYPSWVSRRTWLWTTLPGVYNSGNALVSIDTGEAQDIHHTIRPPEYYVDSDELKYASVWDSSIKSFSDPE
jgi:hypothetical protein